MIYVFIHKGRHLEKKRKKTRLELTTVLDIILVIAAIKILRIIIFCFFGSKRTLLWF